MALAREWCSTLPPSSRLREGRFERFDANLNRSWSRRYLMGRPEVPYRHPEQEPKHYLPFLTAQPLWPGPTPAHQILERQAGVIGDEFKAVSSLQRTHSLVPGRVQGEWTSIRLFYGGLQVEVARLFPQTLSVLQQLDHCGDSLGAVFFSVLQPQTTITPHCGPTNARLRYHLGLEVPPGCELRIPGHTVNWEAGRCFCFDDSFRHSAHNPTDDARLVLVVDLWHPELSPEEKDTLTRGWRSWGPLFKGPGGEGTK